MRSWLILLGGPLVWAVHFFGLYGIGEFAPSIGAVLILTVVCILANLWLMWRFRRLRVAEAFSGWRRFVAMGGVGLSLVAVVWQSLPALVR